MTSVIASDPTVAAASRSAGAARGRTLGAVVAAACDAVACLPLADPRWETVGVRLTAVVDAVRRASGLSGSPIGPHETVAPVVRLRDLGRLVQIITPNAAVAAVAGPEVIEDLLWSLLVAAA
jgi:hypothetical protein